VARERRRIGPPRMQAMILAAGLGTRLRPLSLNLPKPLFPVLNLPLLERTLLQLQSIGCDRLAVNCFHLADAVVRAVSSWGLAADVTTLVEPFLLGTGGALRNALPHIRRNEPLLVINGDVVTDLDFSEVLRRHQKNGAQASLVVHSRAPWNNVAVKEERVSGFRCREPDAVAFTGISVLEPAFLEAIPDQHPSSLIDAFQGVLDRGERLQAVEAAELTDTYIWEEIGTPEGYLAAHATLLRHGNDRCLIGNGTDIPDDLVWGDWISVGSGVSIGPETTLCRTVIWDGCSLPGGQSLCDCIVTPYGTLGVNSEAR
jgi:mannose-1-phosphate guanylyltransferase